MNKTLLSLGAAALIALFAVVGCGKDDADDDKKATDTNTGTGTTTRPTALPAEYSSQSCAGCHGESGEGKGTAPKLAGTTLSEADFLSKVRNGTSGGMPSYTSDKVSDAKAKEMHAYFKK
jgi:mono/diheme cytochrome c family protein